MSSQTVTTAAASKTSRTRSKSRKKTNSAGKNTTKGNATNPVHASLGAARASVTKAPATSSTYNSVTGGTVNNDDTTGTTTAAQLSRTRMHGHRHVCFSVLHVFSPRALSHYNDCTFVLRLVFAPHPNPGPANTRRTKRLKPNFNVIPSSSSSSSSSSASSSSAAAAPSMPMSATSNTPSARKTSESTQRTNVFSPASKPKRTLPHDISRQPSIYHNNNSTRRAFREESSRMGPAAQLHCKIRTSAHPPETDVPPFLEGARPQQ